MRISINWLRQYVDIQESPEELAEMLTLLGFEAEIVTDLSTISGVITARIRSVEKHPNADKLHLCQVDDGEETLSIVCGAPNVAAGQMVPLAKIGAILPGGFKIKKAKIRGEVSFGMLCSERELGISDQHEGILILPATTEPGLPISEILNPIVAALELDITPNRPDALSHIGIAREIAAKTGRELRLPDYASIPPASTDEMLRITLDAPEGCPRYLAGIVSNVQVGPSPEWMVRHLEAAGQRSINNLVDISNYVLLEMGHPTHIFDLDRFGSREVLVRFATAGEKFKTLDEVEHVLNTHHLLITNGKTPVALAGIMGGEDSAVTESTRTVLIESAYFDPVTIRKGSKSLGLLTEASRRFERGADPDGVAPAFYRIVSLLQQYAGGTLVSDVVDAYPNPLTMKPIRLRRSEA
ncbi:MAG: phenylalanine--tRNA ligase subunit beta, partial [FCB group bacterium]|nr:phenylalanine--tRNA ligase subunit beta [FCB group bacterium]